MALIVYATADSSSNAYRDVATFLQRAAKPGDVVVVTPEWNLDSLRHFATTGLPVLPGANGAVALGAGATRVWIVSPPWDLSARPLEARLCFSETRNISGLRVDLLTMRPCTDFEL